MSKPERTPSYIVELPLRVSAGEARTMVSRLEASRRIFNATLGEALRRLDAMRGSTKWKQARDIKDVKLRREMFKECWKEFELSDYACQAIATKHKNAGGFESRVGGDITQKLGTRVWGSVKKYVFEKGGRPRFKGKNRPLHSVEGKTNQANIIWKPEVGCLVWGGLALRALMPNAQQDSYMLEGLKSPTKYCRVLWRMERGRQRWFVQLVTQGVPPVKRTRQGAVKHQYATGGEVGLDIGPSTIAVVASGAAGLEKFAPSVQQPWKHMRRLQRALDRSRRATNPDNFNSNGTAKKGKHTWNNSTRYLRVKNALAEVERKLAAGRKRDHGTLINKILKLGIVIKTEKLSYKAFQKMYGRSVKQRAPGMFVDAISRKAESAGGELLQLNTQALKMSQLDHLSATYTKKPLSQRYHQLGHTDTFVQRDVYSAFLALHAENAGHNLPKLERAWATAEPLLRRVRLCLSIQLPIKSLFRDLTVALPPSEAIARPRELRAGHTQVTLDSPAQLTLRTPGL